MTDNADTQIRVVLSDFGGVLTNPLIESFLAYEQVTGISMAHLGEAMAALMVKNGVNPLSALETGKVTEAEFNEQMSEALTDVLGSERELADFSETYFANLHPNEPMIDYLRELRSRDVRMALVTNNVREWEPMWRAMVPVDELFELVIDSAFVGVRKPEREIFEITHTRLQALDGLDDLSTEECVLVDDIDINCAAATEFGFKAVHHSDTEASIVALEELLSA